MAPRVAAIHPQQAIEGGRLTLEGTDFPIHEASLPEVHVGDVPARIAFASSTRITAIVPFGLDGGRAAVRVAMAGEARDVDAPPRYVEIGARLATGLHQVDNPVFDRDGNLYVTYSGSRGEQVPVSIFRVRPDGTRETFSSGIVNPTSMAIDPDGQLFVSSRFEGTVYRVAGDGSASPFATDLGVACGLTFAPDGTLFVGDRSGTIFRVDRHGHATTFATLPASVAAFHLAMGRDETLFVTGPTLASHDSVYQIDRDGTVTPRYARFGRPQGIAFDRHGVLHVVEALAGASGLYRLPDDGEPQMVLTGPNLVGVAFDSRGAMVVASNDTTYRIADRGLRIAE
jgi:sugar lactone lactonase YvrE